MTSIKTFADGVKYLYGYIPSSLQYRFPGSLGLKRTQKLLQLLGSPQNKLKLIHVAGTSGKTSTSYYASTILSSLGLKTGLHISPHMRDIRERFQINNHLISKSKFVSYLSQIIPSIESMKDTKLGLPTYFEVNVALAFYIFYKEKVDYAVMETGLGGLYDATNVVSRLDKVAIITTIGHDHTEILGKTLDKITLQKTGIIQPYNLVLTTKQHPSVIRVIKKETQRKKSELHLIDHRNVFNSSLLPYPIFNFRFLNETLAEIKLRMAGSYQISNCSLALAAALFISKRDSLPLRIKSVKSALSKAMYPGRMQKIKIDDKTVILDGAHNPQKMSAFIKNLVIYFPKKHFTFLIGFKKGKDYGNILKYILPVADKIILTSFLNHTKEQGFRVHAEDPAVIVKLLNRQKFKNHDVHYDTTEALSELLATGSEVKVITGSLYLLSELYPSLNKLLSR